MIIINILIDTTLIFKQLHLKDSKVFYRRFLEVFQLNFNFIFDNFNLQQLWNIQIFMRLYRNLPFWVLFDKIDQFGSHFVSFAPFYLQI